jgi:hypothetical protein
MADTDAVVIQQLESVSTEGGDKEFIRPDSTVKDLTLRPYAAGTQLQLEQMRVVLKEKLAKLLANTPNEKSRLNLSGYYYIGMFLYIHAGDEKEVLKACWEPDLFFQNLHAFLQRFTQKEVMDCEPRISDILTAARKADNYTVESDAPPRPN